MRSQKALEALRDINNLLKTMTIPDKVMEDARIDPTTDMNDFYVSIVFSERCFKKMIKMKTSTKNEMIEYGTFFYGRVIDNTLYIDNYMSDFEHENGLYRNAAVSATDKNIKELELLTEKSELNTNPYNVVVHFHTHPSYAIKGDYRIIKPNTTLYSDQDLYSYGYLQKYFQPESDNFVLFIGGLLACDLDRNQISMVFYNKLRKDFFNIKNIYYIYHDELFKFNNYDIAKSEKIEDTSGIKLMKELKEEN